MFEGFAKHAGLLLLVLAASCRATPGTQAPSPAGPPPLEGTLVLLLRIGDPPMEQSGHRFLRGYVYSTDVLERHPIAGIWTDDVNPWWRVPCRILKVVSNDTAIVIPEDFSLFIHSPAMTFRGSPQSGSDYEITLNSYRDKDNAFRFRLTRAELIR